MNRGDSASTPLEPLAPIAHPGYSAQSQALSYEPSLSTSVEGRSSFEIDSLPQGNTWNGYGPTHKNYTPSASSFDSPVSGYEPPIGGYEPHADGYDPASYQPYQSHISDDDDNSLEGARKNQSVMDDDNPANSKKRLKASKDKEADDAFRKAAEADGTFRQDHCQGNKLTVLSCTGCPRQRRQKRLVRWRLVRQERPKCPHSPQSQTRRRKLFRLRRRNEALGQQESRSNARSCAIGCTTTAKGLTLSAGQWHRFIPFPSRRWCAADEATSTCSRIVNYESFDECWVASCGIIGHGLRIWKRKRKRNSRFASGNWSR